MQIHKFFTRTTYNVETRICTVYVFLFSLAKSIVLVVYVPSALILIADIYVFTFRCPRLHHIFFDLHRHLLCISYSPFFFPLRHRWCDLQLLAKHAHRLIERQFHAGCTLYAPAECKCKYFRIIVHSVVVFCPGLYCYADTKPLSLNGAQQGL